MKLESRQRTVFIGAEDREFKTEREAIVDLVQAKLIDLFDGYMMPYEKDLDGAARAVIENCEKIEQWCRTIREASDATA